MEAPDAPVERRALCLRRAGRADEGMREDPVRAVEPAVGAPAQAVEYLVGVVGAPAVEHYFWRPRRAVGSRFDGNIEQVRCCSRPHAAEADFDTADQIESLDEDLAAVERAVAVGVLEDQDAVPPLSFRRRHGIGMRLHHPQAPSVVVREGDGTNDVGL